MRKSVIAVQPTSAPEFENSGESSGHIFEDLIRQIQSGHETAGVQLGDFLTPGTAWYLRRHLEAGNVDQKVRQVLDLVIQAVAARTLATPDDVLRYTRTAAQTVIRHSGSARPCTPAGPARRRNVGRWKRALSELQATEREALLRFYEGQDPDRICGELDLPVSEFVALKSRLKARCMDLGYLPDDHATACLTDSLRPRTV